jgi:hypothetical protein
MLEEVFLSYLTQFSQKNNGLDASATNIDGFLWRGTSISMTQLNRNTWNKISFSPP